MSKSQFNAEIQGLRQLQKRIKLEKLSSKPLRKLFNEVGKEIKDQSKSVLDKYEKNDTGKLKSSIKYKRTAQKGRLPSGVKIWAGAKYSSFVHGDINKNYSMQEPFDRTQPHWPPVKALRGWASRKLGDPNLAYAVAFGIAQRGTPIVPFLKMGYENSKPQIELSLQLCAKRIEREWTRSRPKLKK